MTRTILAFALVSCAGLGANDGLDAIPLTPPAASDGGVAPASDGGVGLAIELGTGATAFEAVAPGGPVDVVAGPQGGQHIWTSVRVADPSIERAIVNLSAELAGAGTLAGSPTAAGATFHPIANGREVNGLQTLISNPAAVRGQLVLLRAEVVTEDGRRGTSTLSVTPR